MNRVGDRVYSPLLGGGTVLRATQVWAAVQWDERTHGHDARTIVTPEQVEPFLETHCGRCDERLVDGRCLPCAEMCADQIAMTREGSLPK